MERREKKWLSVAWMLLLPIVLIGCASLPQDHLRNTATARPVVATDHDRSSLTVRPQTASPHPPPAADYSDLWDRIRAGFAFPELDQRSVREAERWYASNPKFVAIMMERARLYLPYMVERVAQRRMPMEIVLLPAVESAYKPAAYSHAHAAGLWQFIPATGRRYGLKQSWWYDGRRDVVQSTRAALDYLQFLNQEFDGDWFLTLAGYNAGENRVRREVAYNRRHGKPGTFPYLRLHRETARYVPKLVALRNIVRDPGRYGLALAPIPNQPYFVEVDVGSQLDLGIAAELAGVPLNELSVLNPAPRRGVTDPDGPHRLLVPVQHRERFESGLRALAPGERVQTAHYRVAEGDVLGKIATRYGISVQSIRSANGIRGDLIRVGQDLQIPLSGSRAVAVAMAGSKSDSVTHRVRSGESLWSIARRYGVYVNDLARWNGIRDKDVLRRNQRLLIYPTR